MAPSVRRLASVLALSATLAVFVAACGGDESPEEEWAGSVCSEISDWKGQIEQSTDAVREELQAPEIGTLAAIDAEVQEAVAATDELAANLKTLVPPDTESGAEAKQELVALASQLEATAAQTKQTVDSVPEGADAAELAQKLAPLALTLQSLAVNASSTLASVKASGEKIEEGFEKADSCEEFR